MIFLDFKVGPFRVVTPLRSDRPYRGKSRVRGYFWCLMAVLLAVGAILAAVTGQWIGVVMALGMFFLVTGLAWIEFSR